MMKSRATVAVIGGSGFYKLLSHPQSLPVTTPFGDPSAPVTIGKIGSHTVAFLPRHGLKHEFPPHTIPYQANLWALKMLGVQRVISVTACGSLQKKFKRGDFVILDQFVDRTRRTRTSFYNGPETVHVSTAYPFCPELSKITLQEGRKLKLRIHPNGTLVVVDGPRFSTTAESLWFTRMGWDVINMTGYPEAVLARELALCYTSIAIVTDYDAGVTGAEKIPPVTTKEILKVFAKNLERAKKLVVTTIERLEKRRGCDCQNALAGAKVG